MPVFDPNVEMIKTAHRIGKALKHSVKLGAVGGAAYTAGKVGYYRTRQKLTKNPKKKRGYDLLAKGTSKQLGRNVSRGALVGFAAKFAAGPATVGYVKGQNIYHIAAHKAGINKRRRERAGDFAGGFDPSGYPIRPRKAPKAKKISGLLRATNESKDEWRKYAKWSSKIQGQSTKLKAPKTNKQKLSGIAVKVGTDTLRTKKVLSSTPRNSRETMLKAVATKLVTGKSAASPKAVQAARNVTSKVFSRPMVTSAEAKSKVAATVEKMAKKLKVNFGGHGRSLGKNESKMTRQELIDATIDYVITQIKGDRSVGPTHVRQQQREVMIEKIIEAFRQPTVRSVGKIGRGLPLDKPIKTSGGEKLGDLWTSPGVYAEKRGKLLSSPKRKISHEAKVRYRVLGLNLRAASAQHYAVTANPKRKLPK